MKMTEKQREKYDLCRSCGWEYVEEFPAAGLIIMRRNTSSTDFYSWAYCTIDKHGVYHSGRKEPKS